MRDPYDVLGVPRGANAGAIKSAFRKLAKKHHPDANKNDPKAAARFAEVNGAYEILGDEKKRKQFDAGEIDAEGKPKFQGFEGAHPGGFGGQGGFETFTWGPQGATRGRAGGGRGGFSSGASGFGGIDDILKDMFAGAARARGGGGETVFETEDFAPARGQDVAVPLTVSLSDLTGNATRRVRLPTGKEVEVKIPQGVTDGQTIRLKGQGMAGPGGVAGDALITIAVAQHPYFERDGQNLKLDLPVTLYEAVLGGKVRVPTLDGAVELAIPANTSGGRTFRLRGKGLPGKTAAGDLMATVRIVMPDQPDPKLEELMREWRDGRPYDPRKPFA
ncbi:MAG: DnaJ C-terminal domain-containing protein [Pseudorhodoplanes sp.]